MIHALSSIYLLIIHSVFHGVSWLVGCSACQTDSRTSQTIVFFSTVIRSFFVIMCVPPSGLFCVLFSERKGRSMNISLHLVLLFFFNDYCHLSSSPPPPPHPPLYLLPTLTSPLVKRMWFCANMFRSESYSHLYSLFVSQYIVSSGKDSLVFLWELSTGKIDINLTVIL